MSLRARKEVVDGDNVVEYTIDEVRRKNGADGYVSGFRHMAERALFDLLFGT
jgi:hypothetical protein